MPSLSLLAFAWLAGPSLGWSVQDVFHFRSRMIHPPGTRLCYQAENENSQEQILAKAQTINTSFLDPNREELTQWLRSLSQVERSEPLWVGSDLLHTSPSETLQSRLDTMYRRNNSAITLFPPESVQPRAKFDWDWKYSLVKLFSCEEDWKARNWKSGLSNTHPLRLQLVAIPANTTLPPHVHPAVELDIPLMGTLYEERTSLLVDPDLVDRAPHHSLGTPLSDFSSEPTPEELKAIHQDLTERVSQVHRLSELLEWELHSVRAGEVLVNSVGSVHRSFTKDEPCLLFVLGPNVHAHFKE
jgi:hypothetical protein